MDIYEYLVEKYMEYKKNGECGDFYGVCDTIDCYVNYKIEYEGAKKEEFDFKKIREILLKGQVLSGKIEIKKCKISVIKNS
jgi:hypothetical protein